ncbi:hypothetical protein PMPD1_2027 [Paramixta manurensis]|uniref:Ibestrophin n=1 Tax=Paramixta manurensis TaxID=2740817 RepID=A0A6M8U8J8_9GAMM|nr:hypothetical protein PMPD1_2027 [Erwiniaceae bacterium PD-1]
MIIRPPRHWFIRLFAWHGSVLPDILFRLFLNLLMSIVAVYTFDWYKTLGIKLTLAPFSLLGIAIAVFLGFRNNVCYGRYTEARVLWGNLLIACRTVQRQVIAVCPQERESIMQLLLAFCYSLKHQLRGSEATADLTRLLGDDAQNILARRTPTNTLVLQLSQRLAARRQAGELSEMVYVNLDQSLKQLSAVQAGCERLVSTPVPFAYTLLLHRTVYLFCCLLPFALVPDLHYMTPLVSVLVSYSFLSIDTLAEELEMPFGREGNHLPLDAICHNIEINLREMNDENPLPADLRPDAWYRLT